VARTGSPTPSADADRYTSALAPPGFEADPLAFADRFVGLFAERFWGSFGWYTVRLPGWATVVLSVAAAVLVVGGLLAATGAGPGSGRVRRGVLAVLLAPAVLLVVLTALRAWSLHARSGQYPFIQGRYVFAGVVGLAVVAALGWVRSVPGRWSLATLSVLVAGVQVWALSLALVGYWEGSGPRGRLAALGAWSGWPAGVAIGLVVAGFASLLGLLVVAGRASGPAVGAPVRSAAP
jgi:hypothetical protein